MAKKKNSSGGKLSKGYKVTLWVMGIILFLAFAFAIFTACGGLELINGPQHTPFQLMVDDDGRYYYYDEANNIQYLNLTSATDVVSDTVVSDSTAPAAE